MARSSVSEARVERTMTPAAPLLLRVLRENYRGGGWHGPSVRAALDELDIDGAGWRPADGRHNIWELTMHLSYTRHIMLRRMGLTAGPFPHRLTKPWWPALPARRDRAAWLDELLLLEALHEELVAAVSGASVALLATVRRGRALTIGMELLGVATHDAYHAGQMNMVRRMWESGPRRSGA